MVDHTFVVLAYGDSPYLPECLNSLTDQTIESNIYIATSTPSPYIINNAGKYNIEVFITEAGRGIAHDWNFGLRQAKTKYVTLTHQDDIYLPNYASDLLATAERFKDSLICFSNYSELVNGIRRKSNLLLQVKRLTLFLFMPFKKNIKRKFWKKLLLSLGNPIPCPTVMYNLDVLDNFRFSNEFSINLDWDAWYRMAKMHGRFVYLPCAMLSHRIHPDSETTLGLKNNLRQIEDIKMFRCFWPSFIAKILSHIYALSYKSNDIRQ